MPGRCYPVMETYSFQSANVFFSAILLWQEFAYTGGDLVKVAMFYANSNGHFKSDPYVGKSLDACLSEPHWELIFMLCSLSLFIYI